MADIGGAVRGGYNPNATEVWQEALRIPAVKVIERGEVRQDVWDLIFANIRLDVVEDDMRAEIGSCTVGERRLLELDRQVRPRAIRSPQGGALRVDEEDDGGGDRGRSRTACTGARAQVYFDGKNPGSVEYTIRVEITVEDAARHLRLLGHGCPDQRLRERHVHVECIGDHLLTFLQMVNPDMPHNDGMTGPSTSSFPRARS